MLLKGKSQCAACTLRRLSHQAATRAQVWDVPAAWSLRDAATVPVAYLTAYYSLVMRGGLAPAHRVLVHSGTGAVGLAAIRIALHRGCEVWRPSTKPYMPRTAQGGPTATSFMLQTGCCFPQPLALWVLCKDSGCD